MDIPVIYLTAHSDDPTLLRAKNTEPFGYIVKPFKTADLNGHEGESWTQPRPTWSHCLRYFEGQGVHREVESEGHEEKYRAVIDGDNPR